MTARHPPRKYNQDVHYMGDHPLFHNAATAKRFPLLATVPQEELASMFSVAPVDKQEERMQELMFYEPHNDKPYDMRAASAKGCKPFLPTNSYVAKKVIALPPGSVFCSTEQDAETAPAVKEREESPRRQLESRQKENAAKTMSERPFCCGSRREAQERIQNNTYMYAMDSETAQRIREMTSHRIKTNREMFMSQQERHRSQQRARSPAKPGARQ